SQMWSDTLLSYGASKTSGTMRKLLMMLILSAPLISGCPFAWRVGQQPTVSSWPLQTERNKRTISLIITAKRIVKDEEREVLPSELKAWQDQVVAAFQESGVFSEVRLDSSGSDLQAEVNIVDRTSRHEVLNILYLITVGIIPSYGSYEPIITTKIKNKDGQVLGNFEHSQKIKFVAQILLYPIHWFWSFIPFQVEKRTIYDMERLTISEAHEKRIF